MQIVEIFLAGLCLVAADDVNTMSLTESCTVQFATIEQGRAALCRRDRFIQSLSRFDKQSRLKTDREVSTDEFLEFAAAQVRSWPPREQRKMSRVVAGIRTSLRDFRVTFPETIQLVRTSGNEEGGAAYCRGNAIILPSDVLRRSESQLARLVTHELFHVLSSFDPQLRETLYGIVGFKPCGAVALPDGLVDRKITNPDAPSIEYAITLIDGEASRQAVPILYASVERYDPRGGQPFFHFLEFRLMVVERKENRFQPLLHAGEPLLIDPKALPSYLDQIGRNTTYIIHPEEVLADNFVHLVQGETSLPTPRIVEEMRRLLTRGVQD